VAVEPGVGSTLLATEHPTSRQNTGTEAYRWRFIVKFLSLVAGALALAGARIRLFIAATSRERR
jgi:hypothetical protein